MIEGESENIVNALRIVTRRQSCAEIEFVETMCSETEAVYKNDTVCVLTISCGIMYLWQWI